MFELLILLSLLLGMAAGFVRMALIARANRRALKLATLNHAWRVVLDDPHYIERRHLEERTRVADEARMHHRQAQIL